MSLHVDVTVSFLQPSHSVSEGNSIQICSQLSTEAAISVIVPLTIVGGTAIQNTDFTLSSQTVTFPIGAVESCITTSAIDDSILEQDEAFTLSLLSSDTVLTSSGSTTITIVDQDSERSECIISHFYHYCINFFQM